MDKALLIKALKLSYVPRWVIVDLSRPQTVSDHVYRTQILALQLVQKLKLGTIDEGKMVLDVLFHDVEEGETGDIPSSHKSSKFDLDPSVSLEKAVLRLADTIEAAIWLARYGINPGRVRRFLESKIIFLEKEVAEMGGISVDRISETVSNIIEAGKSHD
jgi:hypothetical protein